MEKYIVAGALAVTALFGTAACVPVPVPVPEETVPEETVPEETVPEETVPEETVPEEPVPSTESSPTQEPVAPPQEQPEEVPIEEFTGSTTHTAPFDVYVNEAYVDQDGHITDGMGLSETAPPDMEYHVFNIQVTNTGDFPEYFDSYGTTGYDNQGRTYNNDTDAEFTVSDDYFGEELNPGASVETDIVFLLPEGTSLNEIYIAGDGVLTP